LTVDSEAESFGLRNLRDRAIILILADTGLRAEEVCKLRCGDVNWETKRVALRVNANKQDIVQFSSRSLDVTMEYLGFRQASDLESGQSLSSLPLFARHDKGAGKKIKPITPTTIRNIIAERVEQVLGDEATGRVTPNTFLHYFVTTIMQSTGNLKLAQVLARHKNIQVTQRYAHLSDDELAKGYYEIFEKRESQ
jgi:integrase